MGNHSAWRRLFLVAALSVPIVLGALTPRLRAQAPLAPSDHPTFDAASVKANKSADSRVVMRAQAGGLLTATNASLKTLISGAYQLGDHRLIVRSEWERLLSEHFDIEARAEGSPTRDETWLMLRQLLADRFKLTAHYETRQLPVFALVLDKPGKTGPGLVPHSDSVKCVEFVPGRQTPGPDGKLLGACGGFRMASENGALRQVGNKVTIDNFVTILNGLVDRPVLDHTGLIGTFDTSMEYAPDAGQVGFDSTARVNASDPSAPPSIFVAMQEQLGLKLKPETDPIDVLVIDHVEEPSPN
jgi:uncharacterized protein (TIGR03435 family)